MSTRIRVYGWTVPVSFDPLLDHTCVTTYDVGSSNYSGIDKVIGDGQYFWFCWGGFVSRASTTVGSAEGILEKATCLCAPNTEKGNDCHGTIYYYGIDGVCHQVANQLLAVTGESSLNVSHVRGGDISTWLYGLYGLNGGDWVDAAQRCGLQPSDDLEPVIFSALEDGLLTQLNGIRDDFRSQVQALRPVAARQVIEPGTLAAQINSLINERLGKVADALGANRYEQIFGVPAWQPRTLVDPAAMSLSMSRPKVRK